MVPKKTKGIGSRLRPHIGPCALAVIDTYHSLVGHGASLLLSRTFVPDKEGILLTREFNTEVKIPKSGVET